MSTYRIQYIINSVPTFDVPVEEIWAECGPGYAIKVMKPGEWITDRQRRWYKGHVLPTLVKHDENGETVGWWDTEVKKLCKGLDYLKKEIFFVETGLGERIPIGRLTTKGVGRRNMTAFIEEILSRAAHEGWNISAPDPELRSK